MYVGVEFLAFNCNAQLKVLILIIAQNKSINYYIIIIIITIIIIKSKGYWNLSYVLNISQNIYARLKRLRPFKAHSYQSRKQFITQISEHFISRCLSLKNIFIFTWLEKKGVIIFTSCSEIVSKVLLRLMSIFRWCY